MLTCMNGQASKEAATELAAFLLARMEQRGWSLRKTAGEAGISNAALSRATRGVTLPRAETLQALAGPLGVEETTLLRLAGYLDDAPTGDLDTEAAYIARRLTDEVRDDLRRLATDTVGAVVDAFVEMSREIDALRDSRRNRELRQQATAEALALLAELQASRPSLELPRPDDDEESPNE